MLFFPESRIGAAFGACRVSVTPKLEESSENQLWLCFNVVPPKSRSLTLFFRVGIKRFRCILRSFFWLSISGPGQRPPPVQSAGLGVVRGALQATHGAAAGLDVLLGQQLVQLLSSQAPAARHRHAVR